MRRPPVRSGPALLLALAAAGCTPPPEALGPVERTVTATAVTGEVSVAVPGVVTNRKPVPTVPPLPWLTLTGITPDGATVEPGTPLLAFDQEDLRLRLEDADNELAGGIAEDARRRLEDAGNEAKRTAELRDLDSRAAVLAARLEGRRRDEPGDRRIAALQREVAQRTRDRAARRAADVETLVAAGRLGANDRAAAQADLAQAEAALTAARRDEGQWDEGRAALDRAGLELDLAEVRDRLADGPRSLAARHEAWRRQGDRWRRWTALWRQVPTAMRDRLAEVVQAPVTPASVGGQVVYRDPGLRPGARRPRTPLLFVLEDREAVVELLVPPELRDLVTVADPADPARGRVRLRSVARPGEPVEGRIIAIGAAPVTRPGGGRGFPVTVRAAPGSLPPVGATITAEVLVPAAGAVRLPRWAVHLGADPRAPVAVLADGSTRILTALFDDRDAIVTAGLAPGDAVRALGPLPTQGPPPRLAGILEPEGAVTVRLRSADWDVVEVVPDGALVEAGATLARLAKNSGHQDYERLRLEQHAGAQRLRLDREIAEADADLKVLGAQDAVATAQIALRRAVLARRRVGLASLADRLAAAEAAVDPRVAPSLARIAAADLQRTGAKAAQALAAARLDAASARIPDQFATAEADLTVARAEQALGAARRALTLARLDAAAARDRAAAKLRREEEELARQGDDLLDEVVVAPLAGRVAYRPNQPLEPGAALPSMDLLTIMPEPPPGGIVHRRLPLLVPAHRAATWKVGDEVPVTVPGAGTWPARVVTVGTWYGRRPADDAGDDQVTDLVLSVAIPAESADRVLPGMQGWIP